MFLVAEIGVNWNGNFELLKNMLINAKNAGFDSVKFQSFNEKIIGEHTRKKDLLASSVTEKNVNIINDLTTNVGIDWFSTPRIAPQICSVPNQQKSRDLTFKTGIIFAGTSMNNTLIHTLIHIHIFIHQILVFIYIR